MNTVTWTKIGICAAICLTALAGPAAAKSYPKTTKQCSHQKVSATVTAPKYLAYQKAVEAWQNKTGTSIHHAVQKQYSCKPAQGTQETCTLTARPCTVKKVFYPTLQPEKKHHSPPVFVPRSGGGSSSLAPVRRAPGRR